MMKFIFRRMLELIPVLLISITIVFFMVRLAPGGPFTSEKSFPAEAIERLNQHYGLDKPILVQYGNYLLNLLKGDLGPSFQYPSRTVNDIIKETFPVSLELGALAMLFALSIGLLAGIVASLKPNTLQDHMPMGLAMTGICMPSFVLGPLLILVFGLWLGWFNASGWELPSDRVLPVITLGAAYAAYISRLTRGSMLEILPADYIRTARAKGLSEATVIFKHTLKNALLPVVSYLGPATAGILTGSFVVETIFNIPGMGRMFVLAAFNRDYTLILGLVVFFSLLVVVFNAVVDILLGLLNPKLRMHA
ncbi:MAG: ABC transporter permease subunit [Kiritimatiellales bacterium]|nr:ABC transporter permease subunit [Kiritimatiellales bacterium]